MLLPLQGQERPRWFPCPDTSNTAHTVLIYSTQSYGQINLPAWHVSLRTIYEIMVRETNQKLLMCGWEAANCTTCFWILVQWSKHSLLTDCSEVGHWQYSWKTSFVFLCDFNASRLSVTTGDTGGPNWVEARQKATTSFSYSLHTILISRVLGLQLDSKDGYVGSILLPVFLGFFCLVFHQDWRRWTKLLLRQL